jgi:RNA polymerase sigma-70 factor (ECF subfamily)
MLTAIESYEQRTAPFEGWLLRITHNMAIDHLRRRARTCEAPEALAGVGDDSGQTSHLRAMIREALAELPAVQREIVVLRHVGGFSPGEIAARMGRSEDSVHGLHHRGRRALKAALVQAGATPSTLAA